MTTDHLILGTEADDCDHSDMEPILRKALANPIWLGTHITCMVCGFTLHKSDLDRPKINVEILSVSDIDWEKLAPDLQLAMAGIKKTALEKLFDDIVDGIPRTWKLHTDALVCGVGMIEAARPFWDKATLPVLRWMPPWRWYWNRKASQAMGKIKL